MNGRFVEKKTDIAGLPFATFGAEYVYFLMTLNQSVLDASAQYNIAIMALGLFQWDLYRDKDNLLYASVIAKINRFLQIAPAAAPSSDSEAIAWLRKLKKTHRDAVASLAQLNKEVSEQIRLRKAEEKHKTRLLARKPFRFIGTFESRSFDIAAYTLSEFIKACITHPAATHSGSIDDISISVDFSAKQSSHNSASYWNTPVMKCFEAARLAKASNTDLNDS